MKRIVLTLAGLAIGAGLYATETIPATDTLRTSVVTGTRVSALRGVTQGADVCLRRHRTSVTSPMMSQWGSTTFW